MFDDFQGDLLTFDLSKLKSISHVYFANKAYVFRSQTRTLRSSEPVTSNCGFLFTFKHLIGF